MTITLSTLAEPYALRADQIAAYRRDGFIKLKDVLDAETLATYGAAIAAHVAGMAKDQPPLELRSTYGKAFLQIFNLWEVNAMLREFVFSPRLARLAADLMEVRGVRLYHDQALFKEPGGGLTPWHADQQYWPMSSDRCTTVWIPLQATPEEMGPLQFAVGSQRCTFGRELEISDESEQLLARNLADLPKVGGAYDLGEVSFHAGWTFHRAGGNATKQMRQVMTMIYMDVDMRLQQPEGRGQEADRQTWCAGAEIGGIINGPRNPVLWER